MGTKMANGFDVDKCMVMHVGNRDDSTTCYMEGNELTEVSYLDIR